MATNIISKKLSRVFTHPTRAAENALCYRDKMRVRGYTADIRQTEGVYPEIFAVDVLRKK